MKQTAAWLLALSWLLTASLPAQTLTELLAQAKLHNQQYTQDQTAARSQKLQQQHELTTLLPQITLEAQKSRLANNSTFADKFPRQKKYELSLTQDIFNPTKLSAYRRSSLLSQQAQLQQLHAKDDLILALVESYFAAQQAMQQQQNLREELSNSSKRLAAVQQQFELGEANSTDVSEVQIRHQLLQIDLNQAEQELEEKLLNLTNLSGLENVTVTSIDNFTAALAPFITAVSLPELMATATSSANILQQQQLKQRLAKADIDAAKAEFLPTLSLTLSRSKQTVPPQFAFLNSKWLNDNRLTINLTWPLFNSGGSVLNYRRQATQLAQTEIDSAALTKETVNNIKLFYQQKQLAASKYQLLQQTLATNLKLIDHMQLAYREGLRTNIDILDSFEKLSQTKLQLLQATQQFYLNELKLKSLVYGLTDNDVTLLDDRLGSFRP